MKDWISRDRNLKDHGEEGKSNPRTQKIFGIIKNSYRKIGRSHPANAFLGRETMKMLEDTQRESELQKARAIAQISRLQTRLI